MQRTKASQRNNKSTVKLRMAMRKCLLLTAWNNHGRTMTRNMAFCGDFPNILEKLSVHDT